MKKVLLGIIVLAFFVVSCASVDHQKSYRSWEGPVISPSPVDVPDRR